MHTLRKVVENDEIRFMKGVQNIIKKPPVRVA